MSSGLLILDGKGGWTKYVCTMSKKIPNTGAGFKKPVVMNVAGLLRPVLVAAVCVLFAVSGFAAELVKARDGSGVYGYKDTPKLPWCEWLVHDCDRPAPGELIRARPARLRLRPPMPSCCLTARI
jgi:hypothetical protein